MRNLDRLLLGCEVQRCAPVSVSQVDVGFVLDQAARVLDAVFEGCEVQIAAAGSIEI